MNTNTILVFALFLFAIVVLPNCAEKPSCDKPTYTMAVDSELTLLMREMFLYYEDIKENIVEGSLTEDIKIFTDIHKAVATTPEKTTSPLYQAMATNYTQAVKDLNKTKDSKKDLFNLMVDNCMSCHQQMCPGPMVRIKKLYIK